MKLNYSRTFFVGLAFMSICAFWQLYDNVVPLILRDSFGLRDGLSGIVMAVDNLLGLFLLPLIGSFSDRVNTPYGKRTPFIVCGTIIAVVGMLFLPGVSGMGSLPLFLGVLAIVLLAMASYRSPAVALMPDVTPKPVRSMANAIINLMGALGGIFTLGMTRILVKGNPPNRTPLFIAVAIFMVVAVVVLVITIKENKLVKETKLLEATIQPVKKVAVHKEEAITGMSKEVKRSFILILVSVFLWFTAYNAVTTAFSRYTSEVWGVDNYEGALMVAMLAAIVSYIPIGIISSIIGRRKTILIGITLMFVSYLCGAFISEYTVYINVVFAITGIGWATISVNSYPMIVEMCKGDDIGKYTGLYYTTSMTAQIITPILSGFLLEVSYRTLFPYASFFSLAAFITMLMVKHGDTKPQAKKSALENFDIED